MEEVGAIPVDSQPIYDRICRSVVKLIVPTGLATQDLQEIMIPGLIATSGKNYCYIIAFLSKELPSLPSEVILPDGTKMKLRKQDLKIFLNVVAFHVNTSARMEPVDFREDVSMNDEVFSVDFNPKLISHCNMSHGRVTYEGEFEFSHDSPTGQLTAYGGLVFNKEAQCIGISYKDRGVTVACNVRSITRILAIHRNMMIKLSLGKKERGMIRLSPIKNEIKVTLKQNKVLKSAFCEQEDAVRSIGRLTVRSRWPCKFFANKVAQETMNLYNVVWYCNMDTYFCVILLIVRPLCFVCSFLTIILWLVSYPAKCDRKDDLIHVISTQMWSVIMLYL